MFRRETDTDLKMLYCEQLHTEDQSTLGILCIWLIWKRIILKTKLIINKRKSVDVCYYFSKWYNIKVKYNFAKKSPIFWISRISRQKTKIKPSGCQPDTVCSAPSPFFFSFPCLFLLFYNAICFTPKCMLTQGLKETSTLEANGRLIVGNTVLFQI